jgi:hypothetical protein
VSPAEQELGGLPPFGDEVEMLEVVEPTQLHPVHRRQHGAPAHRRFYSGLPGPLLAAAREREPGNPLTLPCEELIRSTEQYLAAAQRHGSVQPRVRGYDLFLAANSVAWIRSSGAVDDDSLTALRRVMESGYRRP